MLFCAKDSRDFGWLVGLGFFFCLFSLGFFGFVFFLGGVFWFFLSWGERIG